MTIPTLQLTAEQLIVPSDVEPTEVLLLEHRVTEQALNCLERMAERWTGSAKHESMDVQAILDVVRFFQTFVEAWHFHREEVYFNATGVPLETIETQEGRNGSYHDHQRCSSHLRGMEQAVGQIAIFCGLGPLPAATVRGNSTRSQFGRQSPDFLAARRAFGEHARAYADILLKHIEDEEDFTYPFIERHVATPGKQAAEAAFWAASRNGIDACELDECLAIVGRLGERFDVLPR